MEAVKVKVQTTEGWAGNLRTGVPKLWAEEGIRGLVELSIMYCLYKHVVYNVNKKIKA